jgi:putative N-acetylmannosamine-6-phosphate epimerase
LFEIRETFAPRHGVTCAFSSSIAMRLGCNRGEGRPYHGAHTKPEKIQECMMDELNGRMMACQLLITGLIARVANSSPDPLRFLTDFRDEIKAVVKGVNIAGMDNTDRVRLTAQQTIDELFSLMKPPSVD